MKEKRKRRPWHSCKGRVAHDSQTVAQAMGQRAYFCRHCQKWHATGNRNNKDFMGKLLPREKKEKRKRRPWKSCRGKVAHDSQTVAQAMGQKAYYCRHCQKWHAAGDGNYKEVMGKLRGREKRKENKPKREKKN